MVKTVVVLLMLLTVPVWSVTRPPDLEPNDADECMELKDKEDGAK